MDNYNAENPWCKTDEAHKAVEMAVDLLKRWMEKQKDPAIVGVAIILAQDDTTVFYAIAGNVMDDWHKKNKLAAKLVRELFERRGQWLVFACDSWFAKVPKGFDRSSMPNDLQEWPEHMRFEALMVTCNAIGKDGFMLLMPYKRDPKDNIDWGPIDWENVDTQVATGRFLFDLRSARLNDALKQAYASDSEGQRSRVQ